MEILNFDERYSVILTDTRIPAGTLEYSQGEWTVGIKEEKVLSDTEISSIFSFTKELNNFN